MEEKIILNLCDTKIETTLKKLKESKNQEGLTLEQFTDIDEINEDGEYVIWSLAGSVDEWKEFLELFTDKKYVISESFYHQLYDPVDFGNYTVEEIAFVNCDCPDNLKEYAYGENGNELMFFTDDNGDLIKADSDDFKTIISNDSNESEIEDSKEIIEFEKRFPKKREGLHKYYHENGQLQSEGNYKDGKQEGLWKSYSYNGQLWVEENFKDDKKEGLFKFYFENGQLKGEGNYKDDKQEGLHKNYHENGQLKSEGNFKDGKPEGLWKFYSENGELESEKNFKDGKVI